MIFDDQVDETDETIQHNITVVDMMDRNTLTDIIIFRLYYKIVDIYFQMLDSVIRQL